MQYHKIKLTEFGDIDVLKYVTENELPEPKAGQVRVKVLATSAAYTDTLIRRGIYPDVPKKMLPLSPGYDMVGVVDKLGSGVTNLKIGQKVAELTVIGAYSEYMILEADKLAIVPDGVDNADAVSLILTYVTAYQMLHRVAKVKKGDVILIHGAGGAVGTAFLQLGQLMGLKMYGTASASQKAYIESFGVIFIDYKNQDFLQVIKQKESGGIDAVFDPMGGDYFPRSLKTLKKEGTLVGFGFQNSASGKGGNKYIDFIKIMIWDLLPTKPNSKFYLIGDWHKKQHEYFKQDLATLFELLKQGKINPNVFKRMPLKDAKEAHRMIENGEAKGKIVLVME
jgi:NADPH2:quinone reductase